MAERPVDLMAKRPFELPEFYVPRAARLNPHVEEARGHARQWAEQMGMLDKPGGWDAETFEEADFGLLCAYTHPGCDAEELALITAWYVWAGYLHAHGLPYEPDNPVERGLTDLWPRTAPPMSESWHGRFSDSVGNLLHEPVPDGRVPNPVDYLQWCRAAGWSADLVEHAAAAELPERVVGARTVRELAGSFADAARLRDDIFGYRGDAEPVNGVTVVETFLGCDTAEAVRRVNDLVTSRVLRFESTAATEVPRLFDDHALTAADQARVLAWIEGLRDWQAGRHAWHTRDTPRAPGGPPAPPPSPGPRPGRPAGVGGLHPGPDGPGDPSGLAFESLGGFFEPLDEPKVNRHLDRARRHAAAWVRATGLVPGLWDEQVYESMELPLLAALTKPEAADEQLRLLTLWDIWTFALDDHFARAYKRSGDLAGAKAFVAGLARFMPIGGDDAPPPGNPVERALADIWPRTKGGLCAEGVTAFPVHVMEFAEANLWELDNLIQRRIPDPVDYLQMRRKTSRGVLSAQLALVAERQALPPDVLESQELRALNEAFADDVGFRNDVFSYRREIEAEGEIATGLLVIQGFLGCDLRRAAEIAGDLVIDRQARFRRIAEEDLPMMCDEHDLDAGERGLVDAYVGSLRQWLAGEPAWYGRTSRYTDLEGIK